MNAGIRGKLVERAEAELILLIEDQVVKGNEPTLGRRAFRRSRCGIGKSVLVQRPMAKHQRRAPWMASCEITVGVGKRPTRGAFEVAERDHGYIGAHGSDAVSHGQLSPVLEVDRSFATGAQAGDRIRAGKRSRDRRHRHHHRAKNDDANRKIQ